MNSHKLTVKLFLQDPDAIPHGALTPVWHQWIQQHALPGHLLIDVVDYAHVQNGPATLLVCHEANIALDHTAGRPGLLYQRKQPIPGAESFGQRLRAVLQSTLLAASRLEADPAFAGRVQFRTDELVVGIFDRLAAPNTPETRAVLAPQIIAALRPVFGPQLTAIDTPADPQRPFELSLRSAPSLTLSDLLAKP